MLTNEDKLTVCETVRKGQSMTSVAQQFNVSKSAVHDIIKNEAKLKLFATEIEEGDCIKKRSGDYFSYIKMFSQQHDTIYSCT